MDRKNSSTSPLKIEAKLLRKYLAEQDIELGHSKCLEAVARMRGFKNWDTASALFKVPEVPPRWDILRAEDGGFEVNWGCDYHDTFDTREEAVEYARETWSVFSGISWEDYVSMVTGMCSTILKDLSEGYKA